MCWGKLNPSNRPSPGNKMLAEVVTCRRELSNIHAHVHASNDLTEKKNLA